MTDFNVDYFIAKFEAIPEDEWYVGWYSDKDGVKKCAAGHCGERENFPTNESLHLRDLINNGLGPHPGLAGFINDGEDSRYQQPTPKQRILAALMDIKAGQR